MDKLKFAFEDKLYYLEEGDTLGFYCDYDEYDKYVVYNGKRYHLTTYNWFGKRRGGKCPIRFTYENETLNITLSENADNILDMGDYIIRPNNHVNYDINKNNSFNMYVAESEDSPCGFVLDIDVVDSKSVNNNIDKNKLKTYNNEKYNGSDNKKEIDYILTKELGAEVIGEGSYRTAYDISNIDPEFLQDKDGDIIKVAKEKESNRSEVQTYQVIKGTELERFFCPITNIGPDHKYIVMEKADMSVGEIKDVVEEYPAIDSNLKDPVNIIKKILQTAIVDPYGEVGDIRDDNIGYYKGDLVVLDYQFGGGIYVDSSRLYGSKENSESDPREDLRDNTSSL